MAANANDAGGNPGDGSPAKTPQAITFTSTPPHPGPVGGTYTPTAAGGASGNPVVFSIDASSTSGACSLSSGVVHFNAAGSCKIDADQAGNTQYAPAPTATQSITVGSPGPGITSANNATATEGASFTFHVTTAGSPAPKLKGKGKLPKGIKFHKGIGSATISGIANPKNNKTVGTYHIIITATFGKGKTKQLVTQAFTLHVIA